MPPHVVIVGGGFGGLTAAQALAGRPVLVTLLDRRNHHVFQPLLYQVATAGLSATDIAAPLRHILRGASNITVLLGDVLRVDAGARKVVLADGEVGYDFLILATGATHSYFGHDEWALHAPGLKTLEDALFIRRRTLLAFERAEREPDAGRRRGLLTFVIIGGGPTGVELAGTLVEIARHTLRREFRRMDPGEARVVLLEGLDRILPAYRPTSPPRRGASSRTWARRSAPARGSRAWTPTACGWGRSGWRPAPCCGRPAWPPRRWGARSARPWTARGGSRSKRT